MNAGFKVRGRIGPGLEMRVPSINKNVTAVYGSVVAPSVLFKQPQGSLLRPSNYILCSFSLSLPTIMNSTSRSVRPNEHGARFVFLSL